MSIVYRNAISTLQRVQRCLCCLAIPIALSAQSSTPAQRAKEALLEADRLAWLKNWQQAEPYFVQAEQLYAQDEDSRNSLYAHIGLLRAQLARRSPAEVSQYLAEQLENPVVQRDAELRLRCLVVKGDVDLDTDTDLAQRDWTEALSLAQQLGERAWANRASGELGLLAFLQGDTRTATMKVGGALIGAQALGDTAAQIRYLTLIANGMAELGKPDQALAMLDKAIALAQANKDISDPMLTYAGKAMALIALGRSTEARQLLEAALQRAKQKDSLGYQADLVYQLGLLEEKIGQREEAIAQLREAARLAQRAEAIRVAEQANLELASLLRAAGQLQQADQAIQTSVAASRRIHTQILLPKVLTQEAEIAVALGQYRRAEDLFQEATDIVEGLLAHAGASGVKSSVVAAMDRVYLAHFRYHADQRNGWATAFATIEQARGRAIADLLRYRPTPTGPQSARLTATEREVSRLQLRLLTAHSKADRKRILDQLFMAEQRMGPLEAEQARDSTAARSHPVTLARLQKALEPDELLLEYVLDDRSSHCLAIARDAIHIYTLPARAEINKQVDDLRQTVKSGKSTAVAGRTLYDSLIGKASGVQKAQRLIIVPDGSLHRLPFETLIARDSRSLLRSHVVTYAPSGTVFELLRRPSAAPAAPLPLLAIATGDDSPLNAKMEQAVGTGKAFGSITRGVFDIDGAELPPLPASASEVRTVAQVLGPGSVTLIGDQAKESALKHQPLDRFRVLHFAVHGLTSTRYPDRSALVLWPDTEKTEDGLWQAREISRTRLRAELVTLSACELGSGRILGQDGIASLVRPFLFAGAKTVVANLWESNDDFSRQLMREFYQRLAAGMDKGQALRQAKLELIRRYHDQATPHLWAGFVMVGESRHSLPVQRSASR